MSFLPIDYGSLSPSLLGVGDPIKFLRPKRIQFKGKANKEDGPGPSMKRNREINTTILIIISAIIFISVVALYDILRNYITNKYATKALEDPRSENTKTDIAKTEIANLNGLYSSICFALIVILSAIILIPLLSYFGTQRKA